MIIRIRRLDGLKKDSHFIKLFVKTEIVLFISVYACTERRPEFPVLQKSANSILKVYGHRQLHRFHILNISLDCKSKIKLSHKLKKLCVSECNNNYSLGLLGPDLVKLFSCMLTDSTKLEISTAYKN